MVHGQDLLATFNLVAKCLVSGLQDPCRVPDITVPEAEHSTSADLAVSARMTKALLAEASAAAITAPGSCWSALAYPGALLAVSPALHKPV
jgi:hypothetical protein